MEAKCYRAMQRAQGKMLREYFSGVCRVLKKWFYAILFSTKLRKNHQNQGGSR